MVKLLIIADDFTGALDTGVKLASAGAKTRVITDNQYDMLQTANDVEVLVMDGESRHLSKEGAYKVVYEIASRGIEAKIPYIYKKTDSALRGNVGSELAAMLDASGGGRLHFIPAFPQMGRITKQGFHYVEGVPIHESVFGQDPYEPVTCSYIPELIRQQSDIKVAVLDFAEQQQERKKGLSESKVIYLYNVETDNQIKGIAEKLERQGDIHLMAGCAGFASVLPEILGISRKNDIRISLKKHFLVACGSVNPITRSQLDYGEKHGFYRIRLSPMEKLKREYYLTEKGKSVLKKWREICTYESRCILDTNDNPNPGETLDYAREENISLEELREKIAATLGYVIKEIVEYGGNNSTLLITGGDSLLGFMKEMGVCEMIPICEMAPGTVLSQFIIKGKTFEVISKSGGFGKETLLVDLADEIIGEDNFKEEFQC